MPRPVPMHDLAAEEAALGADLRAAIDRVLTSQRFILGPEVEALERELAEALGVADAVGCASGSDALVLALRAAGVGPGDEVVTSAFSFIATPEAIVRAGARPVFADIEPDTFTLDPRSVAGRIGPKTRAILPVHLFGQTADLRALGALAERHGLALVEDAAQAFGARTEHGAPAGTLGDFGAFSFFPTKNLGALGDAGLVVGRAGGARLRSLRVHGMTATPDLYAEVGLNTRLDALQAAALRVKLPHVAAWTDARRKNAAAYDARLGGLPGVAIPAVRPGAFHVYNQYTLRVTDRDGLRARLAGEGISSAVYYSRPLHTQPCFAALGIPAGECPEADRAALEVLSIPVHPAVSADDLERVAAAVCAHVGARGRAAGR